MDSAPGGQTSTTLLGRLRHEPADQAAWGQFVERYGPLVYAWCRQWRLQEADAEDVTQAVLVRLSARMRTFTYDPAKSFRAYLMTLARYAWCDFLETSKQPAMRFAYRIGEAITLTSCSLLWAGSRLSEARFWIACAWPYITT